MKLAVSNIAWRPEDDAKAYGLMERYGFTGLEIAPTRVFPENPYDKPEDMRQWSRELKASYGFRIPSMQSIWYGRTEKLFGSREERAALLLYTRKAIDFAAVAGCGNLVFGCPRNRYLPEGGDPEIGVQFFRELGEYAAARGTVVGLEANPPIYHTNYINNTQEALKLVETVNSAGFRLNLDASTIIENGESLSVLAGRAGLISHVHISEPGLGPVQPRPVHRELLTVLKAEGYEGFVSVEMGNTGDLSVLEGVLAYVKEIFG